MKRVSIINVIPFIDIMLVLLAIVLTTATFIAQGKIEINLPEAKSQQPAMEQNPVEIAIDPGEQIYLDEKAVDLTGLAQGLDKLPNTTPIVLRVDAGVRFARFVAVIDSLKTRRLDHLTILTQKPL